MAERVIQTLMGQVFNYVNKNKVNDYDKADHLVVLQTKIYNESCKYYMYCICVCANFYLDHRIIGMTPFKARYGIDSRGSLLNSQDEQLYLDSENISNEESLK